ncbi:MAG: PqqD family protein [Pseudomonadota bacterium]
MSWNDAGAELVLFDQARGSYHALNASGSAIWRALAVSGTVEGAVSRLAARYGAGVEHIAADVEAFVADALDRKLIVAAP